MIDRLFELFLLAGLLFLMGCALYWQPWTGLFIVPIGVLIAFGPYILPGTKEKEPPGTSV